MLKTEAVALFGGSVSRTAVALGVSYQAVDKWPDVLPIRIADRVRGAWLRQQGAPQAIGTDGAPPTPAEQGVRDAA